MCCALITSPATRDGKSSADCHQKGLIRQEESLAIELSTLGSWWMRRGSEDSQLQVKSFNSTLGHFSSLINRDWRAAGGGEILWSPWPYLAARPNPASGAASEKSCKFPSNPHEHDEAQSLPNAIKRPNSFIGSVPVVPFSTNLWEPVEISTSIRFRCCRRHPLLSLAV